MTDLQILKIHHLPDFVNWVYIILSWIIDEAGKWPLVTSLDYYLL